MDKPILFNTPMVQALLEDRKTMTRRVVTSRNSRGMWNSFAHKKWEQVGFNAARAVNIDAGRIGLKAPWKDSVYWVTLRPIWYPGDLLWVRETWGHGCRPDPFQGWRDGIEYRADEKYLDGNDLLPLYDVIPGDVEISEKSGWRPSIHMPRWASRLTLRVTDVRVERVREISEEDAIAEGFTPHGHWPTARMGFEKLWDSINAKRGHGWVANPFVWVISFEVIDKNVDEVRG